MPSTIPSYIYTMLALVAISTLLIVTVTAYTTTLKNTSEMEQLGNILKQVAAKGNELLTLTTATNSSVQASVQFPSTIGYKQYWLRILNDSSNAWVEGSLGEITAGTTPIKVFLPKGTPASGYYISGHGPALLEAYVNGSAIQLKLSSLGG